MESDNDKTQSFLALAKGTEVGHYKIIDKIGAGGMGEVYLAEDTELKRQVALKFLPADLCKDDDCKARFKREAQATAALKHPNIVTIHEVSEYSGRPFFAMEHIEGGSLREIIGSKELPLNSIVDLAIQICEGLQEAHEAGIVHRDVKPGNIILDKNNRPRLLDFGLATIKGDEKLTKTGSTMGTVGYMSPEQIRGEKVDRRSDLFSVGVILYEMITSKAPFKEEHEAATMNSILHDTPQPMARYRSDTTDELQRIVDKTLDKDKETRYQNAGGMLADLKRIKKELEPSGVIRQADVPKKRYGKIVIPSMVVVVAVLLLVFQPWKFEISPRQEAIAQENKLAIMYFDNLADPTDSLKLGEITTNLLITDLSESEYVQVVSSQRLYDILKQLGHEGEKRVNRDIATQIARKAKARWMLLGSILKSEPNIILTAQLVDVESGDAVASQRIEGIEEEGIFKLVDKLTIEIKDDLSVPAEADGKHDVTVASVTTQSQEAYRNYLEGRDLFYKHYWTDAVVLFKKALEYDSTFAMAHFQLASIAYWSSDDSIAAFHMEKAMQASDNVTRREKLYIKSLDARIKGDFKRAIDELQRLVQAYPDEKNAYISIGLIKRFEMNEIEGAIIFFNKAIELDPYSREAYNQLAYAYNDIGQFQNAIWAINKYIEIAPDEANPYDSRAEIYALNGKLDEAIASYEKALELKPDFTTSIRNLGLMYYFKRDYAKAESLFQQLATHASKNTRAQGRAMLAGIPIQQGKFKEALRILAAGIEVDIMENNTLLSVNKITARMRIFSAIGELDSLIIGIEKNMEILSSYNLRGPQIVGQGSLAIYYVKKGRFRKADSIMNQLIKFVDTTIAEHLDNYWYMKGQYFFILGNFDSAAVYFEKANNINPTFGDGIWIARSYHNADRLGDAVEMYEKAMTRYEYNRKLNIILAVKTHYYLGQAYEASGWNDKAIEQYEIFLDIWMDADPGIFEIDDAKVRLARLKNET